MNQNRSARTAVSSAKKLIFVLVLFNLHFKTFAQVQTQKAVTANVCEYIKGYYESLPVDYSKNPTKKYPLLIFLHGRDERGNGTSQISRVLKNAVPKLINKGLFPSKFRVGGKDYSFIVISPQYSTTADYATTMQSLVNYCKKKYRVDESRIYVTGLSMGGLLAWNFTGLSKNNADQFAAMVTVCGGGVPTVTRVANIAAAKLPVWVTNNSGDPYNPASRARQTVEALNTFKPAPPKAVLTVFKKAGHDAWTQSYDPNFRQNGLNVYEWMLSYTSKSTSTTKPGSTPVPPVAKAGANQTITLPVNTVTLNASGSSAPSGTIKSYSWKKIAGPAQGLLSSLLNITTKVTGLVVGVYKFELTVTDSNGKTAKSTVTVTVKPAVTKPPTAKAGANQTIMLPANSVTVNAGTSTAASGAKIKTYAWSKKSGPAAGKITNAKSAKTTITGLSVAGTYQYQVKVTDDKGKSATAVTTIVVKPAAAPPTAKAGANQTITLPASSVTVNASASKAASGAKIKAYAWSKKSGPSAGKITNAGSVKTTITGLSVAGTYKYQVKVTDDKGKSATAVVTITVKAASAVANAGADKTIFLPERTATLDGSRSIPSSGSSITHYAWSFVSGPKPPVFSNTSDKVATANWLIPGVYVFQLKIRDKAGKTATDKVTFKVKYTNGALKANAGPDQTLTYPLRSDLALIVDGTASTVPSAGNVKASWKRISGPGKYGTTFYPSTDIVTRVSADLVVGTYQYQLTLKDNKGKVSTDVVTVKVKSAVAEETAPPTAKVGANQTITLPESSATIDASASKASSGASISSYKWTKKSGPVAGAIASATNAKTTVTGLVAGTYVFQVLVTDNKGKTATDAVIITVNAAPAVANAGGDKTVYLPERTVTLNGSKSTPSSGSNITHYAWSFVSGPKPPVFSGASDNVATATWLIPGVYVFQLKIRDKAGKTATDKITVNVKYTNGGLKANAGPDQTLTYPLSSELAVIVDGTASTVPSDGSVKSSWKRISGPGRYGTTFYPSTDIVTRVGADLIVGTYQYQLTLKDDKGKTSTDVVTIKVKPASSARTQSQDTASQVAAATADEIAVGKNMLDFKINPNPVTTSMNIWIDGTATGKTSVLVYNLQGRVLMQQEFVKDAAVRVGKTFDVSRLPAGAYLVQVIVDGTHRKSMQMIKQ